jgi:ferrous iron transport protein A
MTAADLRVGEKALITAAADAPVAARLMEMGCLPGVSIQLLFKAPLGNPLAFVLGDGYLLSMRREEAQLLEVIKSND